MARIKLIIITLVILKTFCFSFINRNVPEFNDPAQLISHFNFTNENDVKFFSIGNSFTNYSDLHFAYELSSFVSNNDAGLDRLLLSISKKTTDCNIGDILSTVLEGKILISSSKILKNTTLPNHGKFIAEVSLHTFKNIYFKLNTFFKIFYEAGFGYSPKDSLTSKKYWMKNKLYLSFFPDKKASLNLGFFIDKEFCRDPQKHNKFFISTAIKDDLKQCIEIIYSYNSLKKITKSNFHSLGIQFSFPTQIIKTPKNVLKNIEI